MERKEKRIYSFDWVINYCLYYIALLGNVDSRNNEYQSCPLESERGVFSEGNFWMYGCDFRVKIMGFGQYDILRSQYYEYNWSFSFPNNHGICKFFQEGQKKEKEKEINN